MPAREPAIIVEHTPNPAAIKLVAPRCLLEHGRAEFTSLDAARADSPLAARLFALGDVERVFVASDFVAITRSASASWRDLGPRAVEALRAHLASGEPAVRAGVAGVASDAGEVERVLESLRPLVARHGGDVELIGYRDGVVELRLGGACAGCSGATVTLREGIERRLRAAIPEVERIVTR